MLRRQDLTYLLHRGRGLKADIYLAGSLVVKDYYNRPLLIRLIGRLLVSREKRAYDRLSSLRGTAKCYGKLDSYALVLERIEGKRLSDCDRLPAGFLAKLRRLVDAIHDRGIASRDLSSSNIIMSDGEPYLVDFAVAFIAGPLTRPIFRLFRNLDIYGIACLKKRWQEDLEEDERRMLFLLGWEHSVRRWLKSFRRPGRSWRCRGDACHR